MQLKSITDAAAVEISSTQYGIDTGVVVYNTIPLCFYCSNRDGWEFIPIVRRGYNENWLLSISGNPTGTFSGVFYYFEKS